ncbi:MAG TPA: glycosyltransferase family 2 protein [Bryobacteraceae bacterium]|nr:glycosyltransferase family 2 protein [Bryobacteraceae bacterium]
MHRVTMIIPNWNGAGLLANVLRDLERQTHPIERVIVVDDGSTDGSVEVARQAGAEVIALGTNAGFAAAVNHGIRAADTEWIGILNNDVSLPENWLAILMERAGAGAAWFATGKLLDAAAPGRIEGCFDALSRGACAWRCGHGRPDSPVWNRGREIRFPPFTAALFRAQLFERVGLLDERFESYLEDVDFGIRAAAAGFGGLYVPEAVAHHRGSATLGRWHPATVHRISRNQLFLVAKHYPAKWISRYGWPVFIAQTLWGLTALLHGCFVAYLTGKLEGMRRFGQLRGEHQAGFAAVLEESESEIRELQRLTGFDLYWRLYFALT